MDTLRTGIIGNNNIVINPQMFLQQEKKRCVKTDSVDSQKIARLLRSNELRGIHIPSQSTLSDRSLIRMRISVVKDLNRLKQRIKMMLPFYGVETLKTFANDIRNSKHLFNGSRKMQQVQME
ncbi:hypothetical protein EZS27_041504 [termite gut metagenome]|uniref:Transposase IS110-like N-terminal domain-containing protein n=1 Tax=termite gut metagenome TaxID=433724 RepID=A0A5J4PDT3_9ZZZZ